MACDNRISGRCHRDEMMLTWWTIISFVIWRCYFNEYKCKFDTHTHIGTCQWLCGNMSQWQHDYNRNSIQVSQSRVVARIRCQHCKLLNMVLSYCLFHVIAVNYHQQLVHMNGNCALPPKLHIWTASRSHADWSLHFMLQNIWTRPPAKNKCATIDRSSKCMVIKSAPAVVNVVIVIQRPHVCMLKKCCMMSIRLTDIWFDQSVWRRVARPMQSLISEFTLQNNKICLWIDTQMSQTNKLKAAKTITVYRSTYNVWIYIYIYIYIQRDKDIYVYMKHQHTNWRQNFLACICVVLMNANACVYGHAKHMLSQKLRRVLHATCSNTNKCCSILVSDCSASVICVYIHICTYIAHMFVFQHRICVSFHRCERTCLFS